MGTNAKGFEFKKFATPRIIGGIAIVVIVLWALSIIFTSPESPTPAENAAHQQDSVAATTHSASDQTAQAPHGTADAHGTTPAASEAARQGPTTHKTTTGQQTAGSGHTTKAQETTAHGPSAKASGSISTRQPSTHQQPMAVTDPNAPTGSHGAITQPATDQGTPNDHPISSPVIGATVHKPAPKGVAFVEAAIKPLDYELEERWWGWRANDLIDITDNVNNFQMGVLEVTRRTAVALAERITRQGVTDSFDPNLEEAMNWFMVKASSYWFPSAESKYQDGLDEMRAYLEKLKAGNATFYTRADNLIPLLASFEDLLGSCDENLVKQENPDGTPISFFAVDDYFFYAQGVASSMATVLDAVHHDFLLTLETRHATELLHHAIVSCRRAAGIDPWIVLDRNLSSVFANHRANMAAPISHARFYLGQLIKTLST